MVIVPGEFIFVANPRTGSRSVGAALEQYCQVRGVWRDGCRHQARAVVAEKARETNLPVYGFTRHPSRHILSWWYFLRQKRDIQVFNEERSDMVGFKEFVTTPFFPLSTQDFPAQRLNMYSGLVTKWFPLEAGVEAFFREVGMSYIAEKLTSRDYIGLSGVDLNLITPRIHRLVKRHFPLDWLLWESLVKE